MFYFSHIKERMNLYFKQKNGYTAINLYNLLTEPWFYFHSYLRLMVNSQDLLLEEVQLKSSDSSAEQVKAIFLWNM